MVDDCSTYDLQGIADRYRGYITDLLWGHVIMVHPDSDPGNFFFDNLGVIQRSGFESV